MVKAERFDAGTSRAFEAVRVDSIGNNDRDRGVEASATSGVDERLKVAVAPGDQDAQAAVHERLA